MTTATIENTLSREPLVAERYRWWAVFLVREERRLKRIARVLTGEQTKEEEDMPMPEPILDPEDTRPFLPLTPDDLYDDEDDVDDGNGEAFTEDEDITEESESDEEDDVIELDEEALETEG